MCYAMAQLTKKTIGHLTAMTTIRICIVGYFPTQHQLTLSILIIITLQRQWLKILYKTECLISYPTSKRGTSRNGLLIKYVIPLQQT